MSRLAKLKDEAKQGTPPPAAPLDDILNNKSTAERSVQFNIRLTPDESEKINRLCYERKITKTKLFAELLEGLE